MKWDISVISDWSLDSDYEFPKPDGLLEKLGWHSPNPALACCWTHLQAQNLRPDGCPGCWPSCSCPAQNLAWCRRSCGGKPSFSLDAPACSLETTVGLAHKLLGSCHTQSPWSWPVIPKPPWKQSTTTYSYCRGQYSLNINVKIQSILAPKVLFAGVNM